MRKFYNISMQFVLFFIALGLVNMVSAQSLVKDINPGSGSGSGISLMTDADGILYFKATDGTYGKELWKSDGTEAGTVMVKDLYSGSEGSQLYEICYSGGAVFFNATDDGLGQTIWVTDGTDAGTEDVLGYKDGSDDDLFYMTDLNGTLFFRCLDPNNSYGVELYSSDGTADGTALFKDINSGSSGSGISEMVNADGTLFFKATDGTHGKELWKSDGTVDGTVMVKDIFPGGDGSQISGICPSGTNVFFWANNEESSTPEYFELWFSDGTADGTVQLLEITASSDFGLYDVSPVVVDGIYYFKMDEDTYGQELWKSDGTVAGTGILKDIVSGTGNSGASQLTDVAGTFFFKASDGLHGKELWKSDGTEAGTVMVKDVFPGTDGSTLSTITSYNGKAYFMADDDYNASDETHYADLWVSDGTEAGTVKLYAQNAYSDPDYYLMAAIGNTLFYKVHDDNYASELWKYTTSGVGIDEILAVDSKIDIFNIPYGFQVELQEASQADILVFDLTGKLVKQQFATSRRTEITQLKNGIYLVNVVTKGETKTAKIFVN